MGVSLSISVPILLAYFIFISAHLFSITGPDGVPDGNPETVIIGSPLDKTKNPLSAVGVGFSDITGIVAYQYVDFFVCF